MSQPVISPARAASSCSNCGQPINQAAIRFCPTCGVNLQAWSAITPPVGMVQNVLPARANVTAGELPVLTIGRGPDNDVRLDHPAVSETHARLEWRPDERAAGGGWHVVDLGSAKGTFVNYQRVPPGPDGLPISDPEATLWIAPYAFRLSGDGSNSPPQAKPDHLRLDAVGLVRTVKHDTLGKEIHILNLEPTSLSFRPGEFIALVGGSGSGKSTLTKALLGLSPAQQGTVYINGRPFISEGHAERFEALQAIVGYVPQDDILHRDLTPMEALDYVARIRLSPDLTAEERQAYIRDTLTTVELWPHRDKLIHKLSGGQRKRVNIAMELMAEPRLLFLDEPTSGLDPGLDLAVMELLRSWAADPADPRTIILVTHATENVTACKYVAFMASGGFVVYFGPPAEALTYFGVDRFAEIYRLVGNYELPELATGGTADEDGHGRAGRGDVHALVERFVESPDHFRYIASRQANVLEEASTLPAASDGRRLPADPAARARFSLQLRTLTSRYWKLVRRDRMSFVTLLLQGLLVAGLMWAVASPDSFRAKGAENAQTVLFILSCAAVWLGILNSSKEIVKEQDIYARERRYGLLPAPYVLSKLLVLGGIGAFQIATLLAIIRFRIAFPDHGALGSWSPVWAEWFISLELALLAGLALGLFLSASVRTVDAATAIMFVALLIQVMFAGLFFPDAPWSKILSIFTFSRWGLEATATTADLNGLLRDALGPVYEADSAYRFSALHLISRWLILGAFAALMAGGAILMQQRKK